MSAQLQRNTTPVTSLKDVTLVFRYEQIRLLEQLVTEGMESVGLGLQDQDRARDILHVISDGRRHTESRLIQQSPPDKLRGARR